MLADVESRMSSPVLVGRSSQLSTLEAALAEAARGTPAAIMVGGEAGVGKSRPVPHAGPVSPGRAGGNLGIRRPKYGEIDRSARPCLSHILGI